MSNISVKYVMKLINKNMEYRLEFTGKIVEFYTYRRAFVRAWGLNLTIEDSYFFELVRNFVKDNGFSMDNHITFKCDNGMCYTYSDHTLYIGTSIKVEYW